jgi:hypothetical protein
MSLVSAVITDIRVEINDTESTRFTNDTTVILPLVKQAIRRANRVCQRAGLHFAKKKAALTCTASQAYVAAPVDLDIPIGIWRDSDHYEVIQLGEGDWETMVSAPVCEYWFNDVENSKLLLTATPTTALALTIWYYPMVDPSAYTTASTMPWGGRLDDVIVKYVALRIQNLEEMDVSVDMSILKDMEVSIIETYQPQNPTAIAGKGWL